LQGGGWWAEPAPKKQNENYSLQLKELYEFFEKKNFTKVLHFLLYFVA
jgi:hypothetical protein